MATAASKRIFLVDDHPIVRRGLSEILQNAPDLTLAGEARSAEEALPAITEEHPDLVVVDLSLAGASGIDLIKSLSQQQPALPVLVFSMHDEDLYAERALAAGAKGYVMKDQGPTAVEEAIRRVLEGGIQLSGAMTDRLLTKMAGGAEPASSPVDLLSDRELEVFERIGQGHTTREIAERLHLSVKTIETYRANIKAKLGIPNSAQRARHAVSWVERQGWNLAG